MMQLTAETIGHIQIAFAVGTPVVTVAGAYFALKFGLNGQRKDIKEIKAGTSSLREGQTEARVEIAKIATGLADTRGWVGKLDDRLDRHIELDT